MQAHVKVHDTQNKMEESKDEDGQCQVLTAGKQDLRCLGVYFPMQFWILEDEQVPTVWKKYMKIVPPLQKQDVLPFHG